MTSTMTAGIWNPHSANNAESESSSESDSESVFDPDSALQATRSGFVRKVYGLLSIQLVLTCAIAWPIQQAAPQLLAQNAIYFKIAMIGSLVAVLGVSCCCVDVARKFPTNYLFLFFVTVCQAVMVGFFSAHYSTGSVVQAALLTATIFLGLTFYACTTKTDFTGCGPYLFVALLGLLLASIMCAFFPAMQSAIAGFGAILFSFYIVYDTQLIMGGKHQKVQFGVDDYVFAALNIYLDIINLFISLLQLMGSRGE